MMNLLMVDPTLSLSLEAQQQEDETFLTSPTPSPDVAVAESTSNMGSLKEADDASMRVLQEQQKSLAKKSLDNKELYKLYPGLQDADETAPGISDTASVMLNLSYRTGRPLQEVMTNFDEYKAGYAQQNGWDLSMSESGMRSKLNEQFKVEDKKQVALNELYGNVVLKAFQDTNMGKDRPLVGLPTEYVKQWETTHKDLIDGDAGYHAQANRVYTQALKDIDSIRGKAGETFSALMDFTQGKADDARMTQVAENLSSSSPEERQKVYRYVGLAAEAGHIDRAGIEQFAINMGQSFTRGFDFVPQGTLQQQESSFREMRDTLATGKVWLKSESGTPTLNDVYRPSQGATGSAINIDLRGREATPEEVATLNAQAEAGLKTFGVIRELRNTAKSQVDPIRPVNEGGFLGAAERGAYGLAGSIGIMVPVAINPVLGMMAYQAQEFDRITLENPNMARGAAKGLSWLEGAGNAALDRLQLGAINGRLPVFGGLLNGIKNNGIRRVLATVGVEILEQNLQEGAQDLIAPLTETLTAALREDMPDKDFGALMKDYVGSRAETFFAVLPLALLGGGIGTYRDLKNPAMQMADRNLEIAGFGPTQRDYIAKATTPEEKAARIEQEWSKRKEADIRAGEELYQASITEARTPQGDTIEVNTKADGVDEWIVRDTAGKEVARVSTEEEAVTIKADRGSAEIRSQANVVADLLDSDWRKDKLPNFEAQFGGEVTPEQLLKDAEAKGDTKLVEAIKASIEAHGNDPAELAKLRVLGESRITPYAEGQYKALIKLNEGYTAQDAFEELTHSIFDIDIAEGRITKEQAKAWVSQTTAAGVAKYKFGNDAEVRESMAQIAQDFTRNKIDETNLPPSFVAFLKKLYTEFVEFMRRAKLLDQAFAEGKIDAEFERYLSEKIGLSDATMIEREVHRIEGEANPFKDSRAQPEAGADVRTVGDTTIVGPTNFSIRAYHGTPHNVDRFSTERIGTGEGAQVYGFGLYFAQNKGVAESYQKSLAADLSGNDGAGVRVGGASAQSALGRLKAAGGDYSKAYDAIQSELLSGSPKDSAIYEDSKQLQEWEARGLKISDKGNLYSVTIDAEENELLDWDKPLSEQSERIQREVFQQFGKILANDIKKGRKANPQNAEYPYNNIYEFIGYDVYTILSEKYGSAQKASAEMNKAGFKGIKYLDQGSRDGNGEGTSNYVIFDDKHITITERNGEKVSVADVPVDGGNTSFSIRARDEAYDAAVKSGDEAEQQRLVDEAAKEAGYEGPYYHGGTVENRFEHSEEMLKAYPDLAHAYYVSEDPEVASSYSQGYRKDEASLSPLYVKTSKILDLTKEDAFKEWIGEPNNNKHHEASRLLTDAARSGGAVLIKAKDAGYDGVKFYDTDASNYGATPAIAIFDGGNLKLAPNKLGSDKWWGYPVRDGSLTRDDAGNVIPLSQRFNSESNDIRYSIREMDEAHSAAAKSNDVEVAQRLVDEVAKKAGYDVTPVYHGTNTDITAFDKKKMREGRIGKGAYFTPNKAIAGDYAKDSVRMRGGQESVKAYYLKDAFNYKDSIFVATDPKKIKSADPFTYDDNGKLIPLSKRFDQSSADIRYSIQSQEQIDRVNKAVADTTMFAEGRMALYERAKVRFKAVLAENKEILDALKEGGALPEKIRRAKLLQGIAELEVILRQLPAEVRGKVGGFGVLARGGTGDTFLANFFRDRVRMIDEQLEKYLSKEYDEELYKVFERAKPKKNKPGEKPKGIGAEIQALFAELKEAQKWSPEKVETELAKLETELRQVEDAEANGMEEIQTKAKEEARILQSINLLSKVGGWNPKYAEKVKADGKVSLVKVYNGKTSNEKADAIRALKAAWAKGYYEFQMQKIKEREEREGIQTSMRDATNKAGTDAERIQKQLSERGMKEGWGKAIYDLSSFDQVANLIFGDNSEIANELSDIQRKTENQKEDALQRKYEEVEDLFTRLAGSSLKGKQLQYDMMQPSIKFTEGQYKGIELSQMQAISDIMMWNQEDGRRHMEGRYDENGKPISKWHYTQEFIDYLESKLTTKGRAVMDFLLTKYAEEHDEINKVYKPLNGVNLISIENYAPLSVVPQQQKSGQMVDPTTGQSFSSSSITPRSLLTRGTSIAQPDITVDAVQKYLAHTRQMEHWKAFAPVIAKYGTALRNRDVLDSIEAKAGKAGRTAITNWLDYMTNGGVREAGASLWTNKMANDVMGRAAQVALFGRVGTILLQSTQLAAASAVMPHGAYMVRITKLLTGNLDWSAAIKSDYIQRRIKQMPVVEQQAMQELATARPSRVIEIQRALGASLSTADGLFTGGTFAMVYDYQLTQAKENGLTGEEAEAFALNEAERITDRIAQPTRPGARSMWELTATSPAARLAFSFASESRKNFALLAYAKATDGVFSDKFWKASVYTIFLSGILSALARNAWKDMKDDSDDEWFDEKHWGWKRIALMAATDPANGIPLVGSSVQEGALKLFGVYYQNDNLMSLNKGASTARQIPKYWEGDWTADQVLRDVDTILSIAGMANQNMAAYSSLSHLTRDAFGVTKNTKKAVIGE